MSLKRHSGNPILTRADIPDIPPRIIDATAVFNPGAVVHEGRIKLILRVQTRSWETFLVMAQSRDGVEFRVSERIIELNNLENAGKIIRHISEPRVTQVEDSYYIVVAMDMESGCRPGLVRTLDFETFDFLGLVADRDVRNGVLFSERIRDMYLRLERPNVIQLPSGVTSGREIVLAESVDLLNWRQQQVVMFGRPHYWDEYIGSGPPPLKTAEGWLHLYHGTANQNGGASSCQVGAVLLDLEDPSRVLARTRNNILEPRETYELTGRVPNTVFPSGLVVEQYDPEGYAVMNSKIYLYYGAADTCIGLATAKVADLIEACHD
jgi:beta-1,4-mannooligosaccharide/beta-1,4-mannosyl-N-acetylglucosamine phosphorylase